MASKSAKRPPPRSSGTSSPPSEPTTSTALTASTAQTFNPARIALFAVTLAAE